ncbi:cyanase [Gordonia terrae]|uniref:Cyanate hydratase n=2 Tax=Gordonia terrae TaxID=2055 RepID=A0AAD0KHJ2_9ACTN|nr:cyanase [Gordonia terrae]VTR10728.1 XRE family transcriptional regulator [Clostridioides difficile]ANY26170.1 cyanase [Gordonia terrae]AWO86906.1 cyanase [Gordonia terrae]VTS58317.1 Cyanate hydratase [Gordonia terrae]GAB45666.1 cyanate hydratase [Gordonia terrae NBRC 100016]
MTTPIMPKTDAAELINAARIRQGLTWATIADKIDAPLVWTVAALLGKHPVPPAKATAVVELLGLGEGVAESLRQQPTRTPDEAAANDPTIYRFHEAIDVYGPALKELIHEEFGDGIMSAINFKIGFERRSDPNGDRVVVTFDGKFLDYNW